MCELLGISSKEKIPCNVLLRKFYSHGTEHPDGWGLATFYGNAVSVEKEPLPSTESTYLKTRLAADITKDILLAHIRKASVGNLTYENSHPFVLRDSRNRTWTLTHNGTIFESPLLEPYKLRQRGSTDSERILDYLVDQIDKAQSNCGESLSSRARFAIVEETIRNITPGNKVNLLIYDGDLFYVHCNHQGSLYLWQRPGTLVVATTPLTRDNWTEVPLNTVLAYCQGELVYIGKPHSHEYVKPDDGEPPLIPRLTDGLGI